ncbi:MAG: sugar ABC transporter permease, partial [Betaproteobacteria bacterium]|nr:sugar ABC transporter permease [Betaproteobacteria bacterium]
MKANGMQNLYGWGMLSPFLALFSAFVVAPLGFGLGLGFFSWDMLGGTPAAWIGLGNYAEAAADPYFWKSLRVTMVFVLFTVPLMVGLATALAFLLDRAGRRQGIYRVALILPMMINLTVIGILWRWFLNQDFGLFNAWLGTVGIRVPWLGEPGWAMTAIVAMTLTLVAVYAPVSLANGRIGK